MFTDHSDIDPRFPPRRLVYAQLLVRNEYGDVLLSTDDPRDEKAWDLLTCRALKDEVPHEVARRAGFCEVSLDVDTLTLLVVDAVSAGDDRVEALWFVFDGRTRTGDDLDSLPRPGEIEDNLRFEQPEGIEVCCPDSHLRIARALDRLIDPFAPVYLTNGHPPA
ncbi:hypothetical protein [Kitasatospora sp. NPDC059327]|uniref:hypothetical protein n=1 Tax=Kitasatospora sp. NPDC059327 TaxID=3346803 RepID=UPI0036CEE62C